MRRKYHWKFNWGPNIRLTMQEGGISGSTLYDFGMPAPDGVYTPNPHYAYLAAPLGRSGNDSASIARRHLPQRLDRRAAASVLAR